MDNIRHTASLVKQALQKYPDARNSDEILYYYVCRKKLEEHNIDIVAINLKDALLLRKEYDLPHFETVRRTRQKIQATIPELAGNAKVNVMRAAKEELFREYAREG